MPTTRKISTELSKKRRERDAEYRRQKRGVMSQDEKDKMNARRREQYHSKKEKEAAEIKRRATAERVRKYRRRRRLRASIPSTPYTKVHPTLIMSNKKILNTAASVVDDAIQGLVLVNNALVTICGGRVVIRDDVESLKKSGKVTIVSGGGSGHEPAWAGFVGPGMLTAAVCGNVFASPPSSAVFDAIVKCANKNPAGTLVIVKNYTGDRVNFGLAMERAKALGLRCEMVVASDDTALMSSDRSAGRRGLCGAMFLHKVAGAMSDDGRSLDDIVSMSKRVNTSMGTIGVSMGSCSLPGSTRPLFTLADDEMELGLGIHGEAGVKKMKVVTAKELVAHLYTHMTNTSSASHLTLNEDERVAVIINNLGGTSYIELNVVAKELLQLCVAQKLQVVRVYCGTFVTSLNMPGISITFLKVDDAIIRYLDFPTQAPAWSIPYRSDKSAMDMTDSAASYTSETPSNTLLTSAATISVESAQLLKKATLAACEALVSSTTLLNELDEGCGDGDTGSTLSCGSNAIMDYVRDAPVEELRRAAYCLSHFSFLIEKHMGGTSGALYGLFFSAAASQLVEAADVTSLIRAFESGVEAIMKYGLSQLGDRTMLDALVPCLQVLKLDKPLKELLSDSIKAARVGADSTAGMKAKAGRASYTPVEKQIRVDPGAEAVAIWITAVFTCLTSDVK